MKGARVGALVMLGATPAFAQSRPVQMVGRVEISVGGGVLGGGAAVERDASLRANTSLGNQAPLFTTATRFAHAPLVEARVAVALTRRYGIEAHVALTRPELQTSIGSDVEGAEDLTAVGRVEQYAIGGGIVVRLDEWHRGGWVPMAEAGAAYLRQLHEGRTLVEEGRVYYAGGGVRRGLLARQRGLVRAVGVRADARFSLLSGGVGVAEGLQPRVSVTGGVFVVF